MIETLLDEPELFDAYIAIDPSVWWNGGALVRRAGERFTHWRAKPKRLWIATADYQETQDAVAVLMAAVRDRKPAGLSAIHEPFPAEHHATIFPVAEVRAYRALFTRPK